MDPVGFAHPTLRNLRPHSDPEPQVAAATELRDSLLAEGMDRVTTRLPKRGGVALLVGWVRGLDGKRVPAEGPFAIHPDGTVGNP